MRAHADTTGAGAAPEGLARRMEALLERLVARKRIRHAVVGLASLDGSWSWSGARGEAGPDGAPMRPDTPWFLASVTKLHIATLVL